MASNFISQSSEVSNLKGAWKASCAAYKSRNGYERTDMGNNIVCISFSGSVDGSVFKETSTKFGLCPINKGNNYFGSMVDGSARKRTPQPALVYEEALKKFLQIWDLNLQQQVAKEFAAGKTVLFAGHSIGGAIATLATLFLLELGKGTSVSCITFGFPLIGDEVLARAIRRKGWDKRFCHAVSRGDSFSRVLFAPCITVSRPLEALLPHWQKSMEQMNEDDTDIVMEEAPPANLDYSAFLKAVLLHACAVVNLTSAENMDPTNKLIASLKPAVKLSPYRPFGIYVFWSDKGGLWVENYEAVLPILYYSLATATHSISEHTGYGRVFHDNTPMAKLEGLPNLTLVRGAALSAMEIQLEIQLGALGLGVENTPVRLALRAAGEVEKKLGDNLNKFQTELDKDIEGHMKKLREYRNKCRNLGYYDTFKQHKDKQDFHANIDRLNLAGSFDRLEEMVENHQLPDDFQCNEELIRRGTEYRLLVEPLDIANYYRLGKHEDSGHYIDSARPRRYKALEKWLADSKIAYHQEPDITRDSCFWAGVEETTWYMDNPNEKPEVAKTKLEKFQKDVKQLMERNELCLDEVVMGESSFVKWWRKWTQLPDTAASPLYPLLRDKNLDPTANRAS